MPAITMTRMLPKNNRLLCTTATVFMMLPPMALAQSTPASSNGESAAVYYAKQAGTVGGAAAGCGQSILIFNNRSAEVIDILAQDPQDKAAAKAAFDATAQMKQQEQAASPSQQYLCPGILHDFNTNLPLVKDDYQTTVLAPLRKANPPAPPPQQQTAPPILPGSPPYPGQFPQPRSSAANPIFPSLAAPVMAANPAFTQSYVGTNPQANIAPVNLNPYPSASAIPGTAATGNATDAEKLKVIGQLTQVLQSLSSNNANGQTASTPAQQPTG